MNSKLKFLIGCFALIFLSTSCDKEYVQEIEISIGGNYYKTTINGIEIIVKPRSLKVGEEVTISVAHDEDLKVPIILSSKSLGIEDVITTPNVITKKIEIKGVHDLMFIYKSGEVTASASTSITVI